MNFKLRVRKFLVKQDDKINKKTSDHITEVETDNLLNSYLLRLAENIGSGKEQIIESEIFFDELKKS